MPCLKQGITSVVDCEDQVPVLLHISFSTFAVS